MKILITGSRHWDDVDVIIDVLKQFQQNTIIIHGACDGADTISSIVAKELGFIVRQYPADWKKFGKSAGPIRNQSMINIEHLREEHIDLCIAFHDDISTSRGTKDMINRVKLAKIPFRVITSQFHNKK